MASFFKILGLGVIYVLLLPVIILFFLLYGVYCLVAFMINGVRTIIIYFRGGQPFGDLKEEVEAKKILQQRFLNQAAASEAQNSALNAPHTFNQINVIYKNDDNKPDENAPIIDASQVQEIENDIQEISTSETINTSDDEGSQQ